MTVSTELSHEEYTGNGVTTDFDFRFRIFEAKHLVVSVAEPDGTERILTNGTDYTLRGVGSYRGGKVILKMPLATGWKIGIVRDLPVVQETDLRNQGKFFAEVHEDAFDYLTMLIQKSLGYLSLCLRKQSFISDHYDAKGNKISNLGKPVKDGDAVDLGTMKEHISAKDKRSLRVADKDIPALPGTSVRRNKQLGFDNNGMPLLLDPAETGALGYVLVDSFEKGAVITSRYQALHWLYNGEYHRWDGDLPKSVPAGSTPESSGGVGIGKWVGVGDASLRNDLKNGNGSLIGIGGGHNLSEITGSSGASLVGTSDGRTVQEFLIANDSAEYRAKNIAKLASVNYKIKTMQNIRVLFQGDSMTAGYDVTSTDTVEPGNGDWARHASITYPQRFTEFMSEQLGVGVQGEIRAISGFTAEQAYNHPEWQDNPHCDIVFLMYGINDSGGEAGVTHESYMLHMELLIRQFIDWGMGVVVMTCASGGKGAGNPGFQVWAQQVKNMSKIYGCSYFNAHELQYNRIEGCVQSDGVHFNSIGYAKLGEALVSMCGAGGLLEVYTPVRSEISVWPGISSDSIGWANPTKNMFMGLSEFAYTNVGIVGAMPAGQYCVLSFHFYQDVDAIDIDIIGSWPHNKVSVMTDMWAYSNKVPYYKLSENINNTYSPQGIRQSSFYGGMLSSGDANTRNGQPKFIGCLLGRGWKTITIFTPQDGSMNSDAYVQMITLRPVNKSMANTFRKSYQIGSSGVTRLMLPEPNSAGDIPSAIALRSITIPMPESLNSYTGNNNNTYFDSGICKVLIKCVAGEFGDGFIEGVIIKNNTGVNGYNFIVINKTGNWPALTFREVAMKKVVSYAKSEISENMPFIDITGGMIQVDAGRGNNELGRYLEMSADWSSNGGEKTGYWNIEFWGMGFGGTPLASAI